MKTSALSAISMMRVTRLAVVLASFVPAIVGADESWTGTAEVKFRGYSTLHNFDGTVSGVPVKVTVADGPNRLVSATSNVPVKEMSTANADRDKNMWAMFQEAKFRLIKVDVPPTPESTLRPGGGKAGTMPVALTIAGNKRTLQAAVTNVVEGPQQVSFDLAFPVSLQAFKLDPPKAVGGLVKVKDTVDTKVHVVLKRDGGR